MILHTGGEGSWSVVRNLLQDIHIPRMMRVRQIFDHPEPVDVEAQIRMQLESSNLLEKLHEGDTVAITVGSRGICNMVCAIRTVGELIRSHGGRPFMIPAMGSHAGANAESQKAMLIGLGFTPQATGMEIHSSMDTVVIADSPNSGLPIHIDANAFHAHHIIIMNRIKPHVCFRGDYESGLMKMITIGLGKQKGAETAHNLGFAHMPEHIAEIATEALKHLDVLFAVALVENACKETAIVKVMACDQIPVLEKQLLLKAKELSARLYFDKLDALVIDEIGKNISGSGFDTNVVGRYHSDCASGGPDIHRVLILDISRQSNGNGNGLGMADFTTLRAAEKFDFAQTYPNTLTALLTEGVKIPMVLPSDKLGIQACMKTSNKQDWKDTQIVRIRSTLCLDEIEVSENMIERIKNDDRFEILGSPYELKFDENGNLF